MEIGQRRISLGSGRCFSRQNEISEDRLWRKRRNEYCNVSSLRIVFVRTGVRKGRFKIDVPTKSEKQKEIHKVAFDADYKKLYKPALEVACLHRLEPAAAPTFSSSPATSTTPPKSSIPPNSHLYDHILSRQAHQNRTAQTVRAANGFGRLLLRDAEGRSHGSEAGEHRQLRVLPRVSHGEPFSIIR